MTASEFLPGREGVFFDLPDKVYRSAPGISNSMLKHVASDGEDPGSPAHFQVYLKDPTRLTRPLLLGRLAHAAILRPDDPLETIVIQPTERHATEEDSAVKQKKVGVGDMIPWHNGSRYCQRWNAAQEEMGKIVVTEKEYDTLQGVVKSIAAHPTAAAALRNGHSEVSVFKQYWRDNRMILRKARMDFVSAGNAAIDIKTTTDARRDSFAEALYKLRYYVQASYYLSIWNDAHEDETDHKTCFVFIAVEKKPPYAVSVFEVGPKALEAGRQEWQRNLNVLMTCEETDYWPAYRDEIQGLDLPEWAYRKGADVFV